MLKDELKLLAQLTGRLLDGLQRPGALPADNADETERQVIAEYERIKKVWTELLFGRAKDQVIQRYTWFQQQIIAGLSDTLYRQIGTARQAGVADGHPALKLPVLLLGRLLDLADFQARYFNAYLNASAKIPDAAVPAVRRRMTEAAGERSASLETVELDASLKACIRDYLDGVAAMDPASPVSYGMAEYLLSFTETLGVAMDYKDGRDLTCSATEVLFYMNFNHPGFCQWYREDVTGKKLMFGPGDRLPVLMKEMLALKAMPVMTTVSYDPQTPPVNIQLEHWLRELVRQEHYLVEPAGSEQPAKIELKLTVAQLALLVRLLYEEGTFAMKNIAAVLRFFSGHFMTKKQAHISYGSMNKLYYSGDQFTGYAVRELLLKLVAKINKMFFPV
jgi:hypothetical protein